MLFCLEASNGKAYFWETQKDVLAQKKKARLSADDDVGAVEDNGVRFDTTNITFLMFQQLTVMQ